MLQSMTAFARMEKRCAEGVLIWEVRSVNHRYLDSVVRLPEELRGIEPLVRTEIGTLLGRGKIECALHFEPANEATHPLTVDLPLVQRLLDAAAQVERLTPRSPPLSVMEILRWPKVLKETSKNLDDLEQEAIGLLRSTLQALRAARAAEGERIGKLIAQRCTALRELNSEARTRVPQVIDAMRQRLLERLNSLPGELDASQIERELVQLVHKMDVDEEVDRLSGHVEAVEATLSRDEPTGRRLDFLMQEMHREANTLGAKSSDLACTRIAMEMKVLIEQMREQIQNIE